jgi:hypothetical protein
VSASDSPPQATTELGFPVDVLERVGNLRGRYDGSRLPQEAKLAITALLSLPGVKIDQIAQMLGMSWEAVQAVRENCRGAIREFKEGLAKSLESVLELALPSVMEKAKNGKLTVFDLGIIIDKLATLRGEATQIIEHRHDVSAFKQKLEEARRTMGLGEENVSPMRPAADAEPVQDADFEILAGGYSTPEESTK